MYDLDVTADVDFLPLEPLVTKPARVELSPPDQPAIGGRIDQGVVPGMGERLGARASKRCRKIGTERPGWFRQFFLTRGAILAMTGGLFGTTRTRSRAGRGVGAGAVGNWIPCTVIKP